eukprot:13933774-Alexandrium_andersonii.AAC.1
MKQTPTSSCHETYTYFELPCMVGGCWGLLLSLRASFSKKSSDVCQFHGLRCATCARNAVAQAQASTCVSTRASASRGSMGGSSGG